MLTALCVSVLAIAFAKSLSRPPAIHERVIEKQLQRCSMLPFPELELPPRVKCIGQAGVERCGNLGYAVIEYGGLIAYEGSAEALHEWAVRTWLECGDGILPRIGP